MSRKNLLHIEKASLSITQQFSVSYLIQIVLFLQGGLTAFPSGVTDTESKRFVG